jgi:hypothetical protein
MNYRRRLLAVVGLWRTNGEKCETTGTPRK